MAQLSSPAQASYKLSRSIEVWRERVAWGADVSDSPIDVHQYSPQPITEFSISVAKWSDGTLTKAYQR